MDALLKFSLKEFCDMVVDVNVKLVKASSTKSSFRIAMYKDKDVSVHPFFYTDGSPMDYAQQVIDKESPEMYCIISEAWMKMMPKKESKEYEKNYKWGDMKKDPKKEECLFFLGKTKDGTQTYSKIFVIHRKDSEITLKEIKGNGGINPNMQSTKLK